MRRWPIVCLAVAIVWAITATVVAKRAQDKVDYYQTGLAALLNPNVEAGIITSKQDLISWICALRYENLHYDWQGLSRYQPAQDVCSKYRPPIG